MAFGQELLNQINGDIERENAGWQTGFNEFLEKSESERDIYLGYVPGPEEESLEQQELQGFSKYQSFMASLQAGSDEGFTAPSSFDWRNKGGKNYVSPVKNQGGCGSCVAFGAVSTVESMVKIGRNNADYKVDLSEAHLFYCHARAEGRRCNNGWWVPPALNAFKGKGVVDEKCYPYTASDQNCTGKCSDWQNRLLKITDWKQISSISEMKKCLSTVGPLVGCFTVYSDFFAYKSGVYRKTSSASRRGGHCIMVVGYSDAQKCWICKNSWGTNWGDKGYFKIGYGQVGIDNHMWMVKGISDTGWLRKKKITGIWTINQTRNAWVNISGEGWKKINNSNDAKFYVLLSQLIAAKAANRPVNLRIKSKEILEAYVF